MKPISFLGREFPVSLGWDGEVFQSRYLAFDTEYCSKSRELALVQISDGDRVCLLHPEEITGFVSKHPKAIWIAHHTANDWWMIESHLKEDGKSVWRAAMSEGRMRDTMLFDILLRLALDKPEPKTVPRKLSTLASELLGESKADEDPYRMRFGEIIGKPLQEVAQKEPGFFEYAARDPLLTYFVYMEQTQLAELIQFKGLQIHPDAKAKFGHLSEIIQVQGATALAEISRLGIGIDQGRLQVTRDSLLEEIKTIEDYFIKEHPEVVPPVHGPRSKNNTPGTHKRTSSGALSLTNIAGKLTQIAREKKLAKLPLSKGKNRGVSLSANDWVEHRDIPFIGAWLDYSKKTKLLGFVREYEGKQRVHPNYNVIVDTGRTSCSSPNLQQVPKGEFRKNFVPAPGYKLWVGDLSGAELCTFAAYAKVAYGYSVMAEQLQAGKNIHAFFASQIMGLNYEKFLALKLSDPKTFAAKRQIAKPANFGLMGGMGLNAFVAYAAQPAYNVKLSLEQGQKLIDQWEATFPEGKAHRSGVPEWRCLEAHLGCAYHEIENWLEDKPSYYLAFVERVVKGETKSRSGEAYSLQTIAEIHAKLLALADDEMRDVLKSLKGKGEALHEKLFRRDVSILTGRVVRNVDYSQLRNYPFQGLASDVKVALWRLIAQGFRVVGFIHDEILVEIPDTATTQEDGKRVARIIEATMEEIARGGVPFAVEWHLCEAWEKP